MVTACMAARCRARSRSVSPSIDLTAVANHPTGGQEQLQVTPERLAGQNNMSGNEERARENGRRLWALLRSGLRSVTAKMKRAELHPLVLHHGLRRTHHVAFTDPMKFIMHVPGLSCFVSVDDIGNARLHHRDGRVCRVAQFSGQFAGVLYAWQVQQFVGWNNHELLLLCKSMNLLSRCPAKHGVSCTAYDPGRNRVLSGGRGRVSIWTFSPSALNLTHYGFLNEGMKEQDTASLIALDTTSPLAHTCFAVCGGSVWEYDLNSGRLRGIRRDLHQRRISELLYSESLQLLISGSRDGSIKIWDRDGQLKAVYVGHTGPVTAMALDVSGMTLFSGSEDGTLRTWHLETHEQVGEQQLTGPVLGLETFSDGGTFAVSWVRRGLDVWQVHNLYELHTAVGAAVTAMRVTQDPFPPRALCICSDSAVRLIAAGTGDVISALLLDSGRLPVAAEYCACRETVYVLLEHGDLLKANALVNPMSIVNTVKMGTPGSRPSCLTIYSLIVDEASAVTEWRQVVEERGEKGTGQKNRPSGPSNEKNRFLPVVGREDGVLCVLDWHTSRELCQIQAHCPAKVTSVISSPKNKTIITAASDETVKVWRFFPHVDGGLSPLFSLLCSRPVELSCVLKSRLFVAFSDPPAAAYSLVQFNLQTETRQDHPPADDHQDRITGICSCSALGLVATSSRDRKVRIWNQNNRLLRTLCLDSIPESVAFVRDGAALLLGIRTHLYRIPLGKVLPTPYQLKLLCGPPAPALADPPVPVPDSVLRSLSAWDQRRLTEPHSLLSRGPGRPCSDEEQKRPRGTKEQNQEHARLSARDRDLQLLKEGKLKPSKKLQNSEEVKRNAKERYLQLFYRERPFTKIPDVDTFDPDELLIAPVLPLNEDPFFPLTDNKGFFSDSDRSWSIHTLPKNPQVSHLAFGAIPNSALLQLLLPPRIQEKQPSLERKPWRIPEGLHVDVVAGPAEEATPESERSEEREEEDNGLNQSEDLLQKLLQFNTRRKSLPTLETSVISPPTEAERGTPGPQRPVPSRFPRPRPLPIKSPGPPALPVAPVAPVAPVSPVPLPCSVQRLPKTPPAASPEAAEPSRPRPLPPFILQFQESSWFPQIFPQSQGDGHALGAAEFVVRLFHGLLHADHPTRSGVLQALMTLQQQEYLTDRRETLSTLIRAINPSPGLHLQCPEDRGFVFSCLRLAADMFGGPAELILELLVTCIQVQPPYRPQLLGLLVEMGVRDPQGFLNLQVSSWDSWEQTESDRDSLRQRCAEWLDNWTSRLKDFLCHNLEASRGRSETRHPRVGGARIHRGKQRPPRDVSAFNVTPVQVLNYFCEVQALNQMLAKMEEPAAEGSTVLALPPINRQRALLRLGETGIRRRAQEDVVLPPITQPLHPGTIPFINLPLKKVSLCPFSSMADSSAVACHLTGSLRQEIHRYFILARSFADCYS